MQIALEQLRALQEALNQITDPPKKKKKKKVKKVFDIELTLTYTEPLTREEYLGLQNRCRELVTRAISNKLLKKKSCEHCHIEKRKVQAHHPDYTKPFQVIWLCDSCHKAEHKRLGRGVFLVGKNYTLELND